MGGILTGAAFVMAQEFARDFYASRAWANCRAAYKKKAGGLCERCLAKGLIVPGVIVHHKEHLTAENINDPNIALGFDNLELLCRDCHAAEHEQNRKRYVFDDSGNIYMCV